MARPARFTPEHLAQIRAIQQSIQPTGLGGQPVDPNYAADDDMWAGEEIPQQNPFGMFGNPAAMQGIGAYAGRSGPGMFSPEAMAQMAQIAQARMAPNPFSNDNLMAGTPGPVDGSAFERQDMMGDIDAMMQKRAMMAELQDMIPPSAAQVNPGMKYQQDMVPRQMNPQAAMMAQRYINSQVPTAPPPPPALATSGEYGADASVVADQAPSGGRPDGPYSDYTNTSPPQLETGPFSHLREISPPEAKPFDLVNPTEGEYTPMQGKPRIIDRILSGEGTDAVEAAQADPFERQDMMDDISEMMAKADMQRRGAGLQNRYPDATNTSPPIAGGGMPSRVGNVTPDGGMGGVMDRLMSQYGPKPASGRPDSPYSGYENTSPNSTGLGGGLSRFSPERMEEIRRIAQSIHGKSNGPRSEGRHPAVRPGMGKIIGAPGELKPYGADQIGQSALPPRPTGIIGSPGPLQAFGGDTIGQNALSTFNADKMGTMADTARGIHLGGGAGNAQGSQGWLNKPLTPGGLNLTNAGTGKPLTGKSALAAAGVAALGLFLASRRNKKNRGKQKVSQILGNR